MMIIYEKNGDAIKRTCVVVGFTGNFKTVRVCGIEDVWISHKKYVENLNDDEVFVTGNTSSIGNGVMPKERISSYLA